MEGGRASRVGRVFGLFAGALGKLACCAAMMGLFAFSVIMRSGDHPSAKMAAILMQ